MKLQNPFKLQNWKFRKFLIIVLFFQISLLGLFALNKLGIDTPIIRPLIGFIYLSFIPGYLLLRILRLHNLSSIESFLYAFGLSLFMDMLVGFLMNMLYPILGITNKPIAEIPIVLTMAGVIFLLCIFAYFRDKDYNNPDFIDLKDILNPQVLFLSLIPFMAIFGTYLVNYYNNNILLMIMIVVIALVALIIGFTDWINKKYYPYAIWVMAIALIFHVSLISSYIVINDNIGEYYVAKIVLEHNYWLWNSKVFSTNSYNSVLSVVILSPIIKLITNMSLIYVYKIAFPFFYSIIPLCVYYITNSIFKDRKIALISALLFISPSVFIKVSLITKQAMAMLFGSLLIIICIKNIKNAALKILAIFFGAGLIVSHYGTSYLFCAMFLFTVIFIKLWYSIFRKQIFFKRYIILTMYIITATIGWYMFVSCSTSFYEVVNIVNFALNSFYHDFLNPYDSRGAYLLIKNFHSISSILTKYLLMLVIFFATIGYFDRLYQLIKSKIYKLKDIVILSYSTFWISILAASVIVPHLAAMDPQRLFIESFIILGGFSVIGGCKLFNIIFKSNYNKSLRIISIFPILIMLLSGTHFIPELVNDMPTSVAISKESILNSNNPLSIASYFLKITPVQNVFSGGWIEKYGDLNALIYRADWVEVYPSLIAYNNINEYHIKQMAKANLVSNNIVVKFNKVENNSYIQLTYPNIHYGIGWVYYNPLHQLVLYDIRKIKLITDTSKIYDNGGSQVFIS